MAKSRREMFIRRRLRVRNKVKKMARGRPRLCVDRSLKNISVQLIDDGEGRTLAAASTREPALGLVGRNNVEAAKAIGKTIAERAREKGIEEVFFDRGGLLYHGKVKALADAAREGGLRF
jgi:large subunit ribosomal protein L18